MVGRWNEEREEGWRGRGEYDDRDRGRGRWQGSEGRSFGRGDRVFGERDTGVGYNLPRGQQPGGRSMDAPDWQDRDYQGVSPAFSHHRDAYETGYRSGPRDRSQGGYGYGGSTGRYGEGRRFGSRDADDRWAREMRRPVSGGTGGYDYERGYGDGGRDDMGDHLEDRAREAGDFFRRTGRKISNWFSEATDFGEPRDEGYRGARGLGPKGYKRSDERISEDVHQHLTDDHWLDASEIDVAVSGGEVTLSGTVANRDAKHRAERIVEDLPGVHHVQNNLRVRTSTMTGGSRYDAGSTAGGGQARTDDPVKAVTDGETSSPLTKRN